jgi:uncharacterized repeat protein (TIGR03803 family)
MVIVFALTVVLMQSAQAQTYTVLHSLTGGQDGLGPLAGVTMDGRGNLYGTTYYGGNPLDGLNGVAFQLTPRGAGYSLNVLHSFGADPDGANLVSKIIIGPDGSLYGATNVGALTSPNNAGIVFKLNLPPTVCKSAICNWSESVAYQIPGLQQGGYPDSAPIFDPNGNMFGALPGDICCGVVYQLTRSGSAWAESLLYSFTGGSDGNTPSGGVIRDQAGNLYGVTSGGGSQNGGVVYQLTPSGSGWTEQVLHNFVEATDGINPEGGLVFDQAGNLYGTTTLGGAHGGGTVFKLSHAGGTWTSTVIYSFADSKNGPPRPGANLSFDAVGNLYGTTTWGGSSGQGTIFKLTPTGGSWTYKSLKDFNASCSDGCQPVSDVIFDASGNLYGTASAGGSGACRIGCGVVWKIKP